MERKKAGRPYKPGLDYFSHPVSHSSKETILINRYGANGYAVYYALLEKITSDKGYYFDINDNDEKSLISSYLKIDENEFDKILNFATEKGLFDIEMYKKHKILTSSHIQEQYVYVCGQAKRTQIVLAEQYYLLSDIFFNSLSESIKSKLYILPLDKITGGAIV